MRWWCIYRRKERKTFFFCFYQYWNKNILYTIKQEKLFYCTPNTIEFLGYISCYLWDRFKLLWHLWYDSYQRRTCCILGGYAFM